MNIFIALDNPRILERYVRVAGGRFRPLSALIATNYIGKLFDIFVKLKAKGKLDKLFLDSGTFTRNQEGRGPDNDHDFELYMDMIERIGKEFDLIAAYDVDFRDPKRNQHFYFEMLRRLQGTGIEKRVVPVMHDSVKPGDEFDLYAGAGAEVIAIGSTPPLSVAQWKLLNRKRFWSGVEIHMMGNLGAPLLKAKKPEYADSARFAHDAKYGDICVWNPVTMNLNRVHVTNSDEYTDEVREFVMSTFGFTPADLMADVTNKWIVNLFGINQMQDFLTNEWYPNNWVKDW